MKTLLVSLFAALYFQVAISQDQNTFQSKKLVKLWESPNSFKTPESVCFDPSHDVLYISNIDGKPTDKDGNGFISRLGTDGAIKELRWVTGLNAPKGMGIVDGTLYVTDIDRIAAIDIKSGAIEKFYEFPEAKFLNDIAVDVKGAVYVSDMASTRIYRIFEDKTETWLDNEVLTGPNGLYVDNDFLLIGCNKIVRVGLDDRVLSVWLDNTGGIDGLEAIGDGRYIFSDWQGHVYVAGKDKQIEKVLDTTPANINAADIEFIPGKNLLFIPTFGDNRVMAYRLN